MIPKIDVRTCNIRKEYSGELNFEYEADASLVDLPFTELHGPVRVSLTYEIFEDNDVEVKGTLRFSLKGLCSRCLNEVEKAFEAEIDACFTEGEDDGENYGYRSGVVNLEELLRDTLLVALPPRLECDEACEPPVWNQ